MFNAMPPKLIECHAPVVGTETELLIVEGDSAADAVANARDASFQAVLPMQGKPLNAWKASRSTVAKNQFYDAIIQSIGAGWGDVFKLGQSRYERVVMIFDPDADGIHCGMLVLLFFYKWMRPLLESGRIILVHPPLCQIVATGRNDSVFVGTPEEASAAVRELQSQGFSDAVRKPFRGLASMGGAVLSKHCIAPATRSAMRMRPEDALMALRIFAPNALKP